MEKFFLHLVTLPIVLDFEADPITPVEIGLNVNFRLVSPVTVLGLPGFATDAVPYLFAPSSDSRIVAWGGVPGLPYAPPCEHSRGQFRYIDGSYRHLLVVTHSQYPPAVEYCRRQPGGHKSGHNEHKPGQGKEPIKDIEEPMQH